jgi:hypothetical protein
MQSCCFVGTGNAFTLRFVVLFTLFFIKNVKLSATVPGFTLTHYMCANAECVCVRSTLEHVRKVSGGAYINIYIYKYREVLHRNN